MKLTIPITPMLRVQLMHAHSFDLEVPDTAVPEGWHLMPDAITEEMTDLALTMSRVLSANELDQLYIALIDAAPKPEGGAA